MSIWTTPFCTCRYSYIVQLWDIVDKNILTHMSVISVDYFCSRINKSRFQNGLVTFWASLSIKIWFCLIGCPDKTVLYKSAFLGPLNLLWKILYWKWLVNLFKLMSVILKYLGEYYLRLPNCLRILLTQFFQHRRTI